jgi:predicted transcriptional regulator
MSLKAKGLLALCLALPDNWNYSLNGLCAICKESQTSIRSALKELETFNYLKRNRLQNDKGHFIYEYVIYELPHSENLYTAKRHTEKAHKENRRQQRTKQQNTKQQSNNNNFMNELKSLYDGVDNGE